MLLSYLDSIYYHIQPQGIIRRTFRYSVRVLTNLVIWASRTKSRSQDVNVGTVIVSMTSYPARFGNLHLVIKSILNQDAENIKVILWLSKLQVPDISNIPKKILSLRNKGLEIRLGEDDLKPHKKYFYAFKEFPNHTVITVDDDIIYNPKLISTLLCASKEHPCCVTCNRGSILSRSNYNSWGKITNVNEECVNILPTGIGGVLYPPKSYDSNIFNIDAIKNTCLYGDDLWLNFMCRLKGTRIVYTGMKTGLITILGSQDTALCNKNLGDNRNDDYIRKITAWAEKELECDFFVNSTSM